MFALVQRVSEASVEVDDRVVGKIGKGLLILLGVHRDDTQKGAAWTARKCANLRIFPDEEGLMNRSLMEAGGEALVVSQFTLYGSTAKGNRPSFSESAPPERAEELYEIFIRDLGAQLGKKVETGIFGAMMKVRLLNDGPVTFRVERIL